MCLIFFLNCFHTLLFKFVIKNTTHCWIFRGGGLLIWMIHLHVRGLNSFLFKLSGWNDKEKPIFFYIKPVSGYLDLFFPKFCLYVNFHYNSHHCFRMLLQIKKCCFFKKVVRSHYTFRHDVICQPAFWKVIFIKIKTTPNCVILFINLCVSTKHVQSKLFVCDAW